MAPPRPLHPPLPRGDGEGLRQAGQRKRKEGAGQVRRKDNDIFEFFNQISRETRFRYALRSYFSGDRRGEAAADLAREGAEEVEDGVERRKLEEVVAT